MRVWSIRFSAWLLRLFRYADFGALNAALLKFLNPTGRVQNFLLAREKGMANAADLDMNFGER